MAFCKKEKTLMENGSTSVDNKFILNYLPDAPPNCVFVYLLGLALTESDGEDNSCETIAKKLNISKDDVISAYLYWEELGLVHILNDDPAHVIYFSVRDSASSVKKIKPSKYAKFNREMQEAIEGRMITPNEYYQYYMFLENSTFEPEALVAVAKYCVALKGNGINYGYILTVAENQKSRGATTLATVQDRLNCQQKYDDDLKLVFKELRSSRSIEYIDRENYEKWIKNYGFTFDVIVNVAKRCKTGGMTKLNAMLGEYYKHGALSVKEIDDYENVKTRLYDLALAINKSIGVYYQSLDAEVEEYVSGWINKGYDDETLVSIAKYCFRVGIRTLAGLASVIDKLYKNGVTTLPALEQYLAETARKDEAVKAVLSKAGLDRNVTANDRALYRTWTENWQISADAIEYVAEKSAGTNAPMAYVNRVLSDCKRNGATTLQQVKEMNSKSASAAASIASKAYVGGRDMERREYTDEQLNALFNALDDTED